MRKLIARLVTEAVQGDLRENDLTSRKFVDMDVATETSRCQGVA